MMETFLCTFSDACLAHNDAAFALAFGILVLLPLAMLLAFAIIQDRRGRS